MIVVYFRMMIVEKFREQVPFDVPQHIKMWSNEKKLQWIMSLIDPMLDDLYVEVNTPSTDDIAVGVVLGDVVHHLTFPPDMAGQMHSVVYDNSCITFRIPGPAPPVKPDDELCNYSTSYLRAMMDFIVFDRIIRAGDVDRLAPMLKRFIPTFIGLSSYRSKYAIEAVNFITKTEWILDEPDSVAVKMRAFVNRPGKKWAQ